MPDIFLFAGEPSPADVRLRDPTTAGGPSGALLEAAVSGTAQISGSLTTEIRLAVTVTGTAAVTAPLTTEIRFAVLVTGAAAITADLTTQIRLAVACLGSATVTAGLTTEIQLAVSMTGTASIAAPLTTELRVAVMLTGAASVAADLSTVPPTPAGPPPYDAIVGAGFDVEVQDALDALVLASATGVRVVAAPAAMLSALPWEAMPGSDEFDLSLSGASRDAQVSGPFGAAISGALGVVLP